MATVQPMPRPRTIAEFETIRPQMIDTLGRPLRSSFCTACGRSHFTVEPHLSEIRCPRCRSTSARCQRPSGHDAESWHVERFEELDRISDEREAAGIPVVAPWPDPAPTLFDVDQAEGDPL